MHRPKVAIAGAAGFVGRALCGALADDYHVIGLSRNARQDESVEWRCCDLYSLSELERALEGVEYAIYLVHSMLPSARLTQASFKDLDLVLADNFARASQAAGVKQIVYLGGLIPPKSVSSSLSPHLSSRLEVENALRAHGACVTALRAGLVVGPGGSSLDMLTKLVRRLPAMLTPRWTNSPTQPIALADVVRAFKHVLGNNELDGSFDIGGPDVMTYRDMMKRTAHAMGLRRPMMNVAFFTPGLSTLWVSLFTGAPVALVGPLIKSLRHEMTVADNPVQRWLLPDALGFEEALRVSFERRPLPQPSVTRSAIKKQRARQRGRNTVRSVQRLPRPSGASARWIAEEYVRWLPTAPIPGLRCRTEGNEARFFLGFLRKPLLILRLSDSRSLDGRALFYIEGGILARTGGPLRGRFEFRLTPDGRSVLAAVHDFRPALPWYIYESSQAIVHLLVMRSFAIHLRQLDRGRHAIAAN